MDHFRFSRTVGVSVNVTTLFATTSYDSHTQNVNFETDVKLNEVENLQIFLQFEHKHLQKSLGSL